MGCLMSCIFPLTWYIFIKKCPQSPHYDPHGTTLFQDVTTISTTTVAHTWSNLRTVYTASEMCGIFHGKVLDADNCAVDSLEVDKGMLGVLEGVQTPGELCGVLQGNWQGTICTVNLKDSGTGNSQDKQVACGELLGEWTGNKCII